MNSNSGKIVVGVAALMVSGIMFGQTRRISKLEKEKSELDNKASKAKKNKEVAELKLEELREANRILEEELISAGDIKSIISYEEKASQSKKVKELYNKISKLNDEIKLKEDEFNLFKEKHKNSVHNLNSIIESKDREITSLYVKVNELKKELLAKPKIKEVPVKVEVEKEVVDINILKKVEDLESENSILKTRCEGQTAKIKELKLQNREYNIELKNVKEELGIFKNQIKSVISTKTEETDVLKQLSRTLDRVGKKASKTDNRKK